MKVAVISCSRDGTGYGHSANDLMLALDSAGVDVVSLWVTLSGDPTKEIPEQIERFEKKSLEDVDAIIQYILPQYYVKTQLPSVGVFMYETNHFIGSNWQYQCNIMDEIWVFTPEMVEACHKSRVKAPVREIDFTHDFSKDDRTFPSLIPELNNRFVFYTISELSYRKNIAGLITAYYHAFSLKDNVALIIKCFQDNRTPKETEKEFDKAVQTVKGVLKRGPKYQYPPILLLTQWLTEDQIMSLHQTGDCFITLSRGEGQSIPLFNAVARGNMCIAPDWNGPRKVLKDLHGSHILLNGSMKPVIGMGHTLPNLYMSDEQWFDPSIIEASLAMKMAKTIGVSPSSLAQASKDLKAKFNCKKVGQDLRSHLENLIGNKNYEPCLISQ